MTKKQRKESAEEKLKSARKLARDENGRAVINMTVKNDDNFLSVFSTTDTPTVSSEVAEFIESRTENILPHESLALHIHSDCIDGYEEELYRKGISEYYLEKYVSNMYALKKNRFIVALLSILGILILSLSVYIGYRFEAPLWTEVIDIVAWVFIWEAVDIGVFQNKVLRQNHLRYLNLSDMDVKFIKNK